jgi:hypothetical protein
MYAGMALRFSPTQITGWRQHAGCGAADKKESGSSGSGMCRNAGNFHLRDCNEGYHLRASCFIDSCVIVKHCTNKNASTQAGVIYRIN